MVPSASIMKCAESPQPPLGRTRLCIDLKQEREFTQPSKCSTNCETISCRSVRVRWASPFLVVYRSQSSSQHPPT